MQKPDHQDADLLLRLDEIRHAASLPHEKASVPLRGASGPDA